MPDSLTIRTAIAVTGDVSIDIVAAGENLWQLIPPGLDASFLVKGDLNAAAAACDEFAVEVVKLTTARAAVDQAVADVKAFAGTKQDAVLDVPAVP